MKRFLITLYILLTSSTVLAIEVSEEMLNNFVEQKLAQKAHRDVQILNPKILLLEGFATICAKVRTKAFPRDVDFCANMTPKWRQETGSLLATKISLISLNAPDVPEANKELVKSIINQVLLPRLEGIEVYKTDEFIGKQISSLTVMPGRLDLSM